MTSLSNSLGNVPLPAEDVAVVDAWVNALNAKMPAHAAARLRYRAESYRNAITLLECQLMGDDPTTDWIEVPFARLRFTRSRGWELYSTKSLAIPPASSLGDCASLSSEQLSGELRSAVGGEN
jgi:hypothetical protein